jgi:hypothetical protein
VAPIVPPGSAPLARRAPDRRTRWINTSVTSKLSPFHATPLMNAA